MLRILDIPASAWDREQGYLATRKTYRHDHLRFEYRWGDKHVVGAERGGGLLYHVVGPDKLWPRSHAQFVKSGTYEKPGWNQVELIVTADSVTHIVNGEINNRVTDPRQPAAGGTAPLAAGRIAF